MESTIEIATKMTYFESGPNEIDDGDDDEYSIVLSCPCCLSLNSSSTVAMESNGWIVVVSEIITYRNDSDAIDISQFFFQSGNSVSCLSKK